MICIVAGARPNFIKVAPLVRAISKAKENGQDIDYKLVYTGAANDNTLEPSLFDDLQIPRPDVFLGVDSNRLNEITGNVMSAFDQYLVEHPTDVVIVVDDLASTMAAAIVSKKLGVTLAHLVAGTRSFNIDMPKEVNRLVIDGLSDLLFTAGMGGNSIVTREGAEMSQIYLVGNILMDTLRFNRNRTIKPEILSQKNIADGEYLVFTLNRRVLIGNETLMQDIVKTIVENSKGMPVIAPLRGLAAEVVKRCLEKLPRKDHFIITEPLSYLSFAYLTEHAKGVITDSGNVAEEATFNLVPCVTLNNYAEHAETVSVGTNVLVGEDVDKLSAAITDMMEGRWKKAAIPDRWDGRTAERIVQILSKYTKSTL